MALIGNIVVPLAKLVPDLAPNALALRAQTLFASVHGVVQMSLNGQFAGSPRAHLMDEVTGLVAALAEGIRDNGGAG